MFVESGFTILALLLLLGFVVFLAFLIKGIIKTFHRQPVVAILCLIFLFPIWIIWSIFELFTDEINPENKKQKPTKVMYVGVWVLTMAVGGILCSIADVILGVSFGYDLDGLSTFIILTSIAYVLINASVFIFIYDIFKILNVRRVFPYLVVLGGLGTLLRMGLVSKIYFDLDVDFTIFYISEVASFFVILYSIYSYYIRKPDRWY